MKFLKWKSMVITSLVCVSPVILGVALWDRLPETMAVHFNINNEPDNFASKGFVVLGLPLLMALLQVISCVINDINAHKHGERKKFERVTKWIIPPMTVVMQVVTLGYGLGWNIDIRKTAAFIVGILFIVTGNYLPKLDYVKNSNVDTAKARKINRFMGYETVIMGILFLVSVFLPPVSTIICLVLLIPYAVISAVYGVVVGRK